MSVWIILGVIFNIIFGIKALVEKELGTLFYYLLVDAAFCLYGIHKHEDITALIVIGAIDFLFMGIVIAFKDND